MEEFLKKIRDDHHNFDKGTLQDHLGSDPVAFFKLWYEEAINQAVFEPQSMIISTVNEINAPSSRVVYLKEILNNNFVFYTNYKSEKGSNISFNNQISALFFWPTLERQIRIEGRAQKVSAEISDAYFNSRPRGSQLGAWASNQSQVVKNRGELEAEVEKIAIKFPNDVPRPDFWGGYEILPFKFEFWQGRPSRLHDRMVFEKNQHLENSQSSENTENEQSWNLFRINP